MVDATYNRYIASDRSYFSILKKDIHSTALVNGFDNDKLADLDIILSEITSNLHKYAKDGEILAGLFSNGGQVYIELISIDHGPGIIDLSRMLQDGNSSSNTLGMGLGSINRLSDTFDIYSQKGWGTILMSRIYSKKQDTLPPPSKFTICPLVITMPGQTHSGDATYYKVSDRSIKILVADGLGHGKDANHAVNEAINAFKACPYDSPAEIIRFIHQFIRKTRGIVATVMIYDFSEKQWKLAGIGNISTRMSNFLKVKNYMSYNGIIGHNIPSTIHDQTISLDDYHQVTLCSDGIKSRWDHSLFPGISRCCLSIQAAAIYKEFGRQTDDMSVVIAKINQR